VNRSVDIFDRDYIQCQLQPFILERLGVTRNSQSNCLSKTYC